MSYSLSLPVVHNQLLGFAEVKMEVVVLAPRCPGSDLLSVRCLFVVRDPADDDCVISKLGGRPSFSGRLTLDQRESSSPQRGAFWAEKHQTGGSSVIGAKRSCSPDG